MTEELTYEEYLDLQIGWDNDRERFPTDGVECSKCKSKGIIYVKRVNELNDIPYEAITDCVCANKRRIVQKLKNSELDLERYSLSSYRHNEPWQQAIYDKAKEFINNPNRFFFIGGISGSGKSHICSAICIELIQEQKRDIEFCLWRDTITLLKQNANNSEIYQPTIKRLKEAEVLYIDDFFKVQQGQSPTPADISIAFEIIDARYRRRMPTLISSELPITTLYELDKALAGRIKEASCGLVLTISDDPLKNMRMR